MVAKASACLQAATALRALARCLRLLTAEMGRSTVMDSLNECDVVLVWYDVPAPTLEALTDPFEQGNVAEAATPYEIVFYCATILLARHQGLISCDFVEWLDEVLAAIAAGTSYTNSMSKRLTGMLTFKLEKGYAHVLAHVVATCNIPGEYPGMTDTAVREYWRTLRARQGVQASRKTKAPWRYHTATLEIGKCMQQHGKVLEESVAIAMKQLLKPEPRFRLETARERMAHQLGDAHVQVADDRASLKHARGRIKVLKRANTNHKRARVEQAEQAKVQVTTPQEEIAAAAKAAAKAARKEQVKKTEKKVKAALARLRPEFEAKYINKVARARKEKRYYKKQAVLAGDRLAKLQEAADANAALMAENEALKEEVRCHTPSAE